MASPVRILITGKGGKAGSWAIRAQQIGDALGATVMPMADAETIARHDVVILVKRTPASLVQRIRASGRPWVYDVVDAWPQPAGNAWSETEARRWLQGHVRALRPTACIYATRRQRDDADWPGVVIYHHARPGQAINPIRRIVTRIGYAGRPDYIARLLDDLRPMLPSGVETVINPARLADVDVLLALRSGVWDGYAPRAWKSNVKLANAMATGTPIICAPESGYTETFEAPSVFWAESTADVLAAMRCLEPQASREQVAAKLLKCAPRYTLEAAAGQYRELLRSAVK